MGWITSDVTGWAAFGSLVLTLLAGLLSERIVTRRALARAVATARAEALAESAGDHVQAVFFKEAHGLERERNQALTDGLVTIVKEIRAAVADPARRPL